MKSILAIVSVLFALAFIAGTASAVVVNQTYCDVNCTFNSTIDIDIKQVSLVAPWFAPSGIRDHLVAVFEIVFAEDLYVDGKLLSSIPLADPVVGYDPETFDTLGWFPGEVAFALSGTLSMTCGPDDTIVDERLYILPAVENPLGMIYGWQFPFDNSTKFPANQLVLVLELDDLKVTDTGRFYADPVFAFDLDILKDCKVYFTELLTNKNDTSIPEHILNFTAAEWNPCDPTSLATEREAIASAIDDYAVNVAAWLAMNNEEGTMDATVGAALAYAALPMWAEAWTMCESDTATLTGWSYGLTSEDAAYCNKTSMVNNATCDALNADNLFSIAECEVENKKWGTDPCCNASMTECCIDHAIYYKGDLFADYAITADQCSHEWSVDNRLRAMTNDDEFDVAPQEYIDALTFAQQEVDSLNPFFEVCAAIIGSSEEPVAPRTCGGDADIPCFTAGGCLDGYCVNPMGYDDDLAVVECVAYFTFDSYDVVTDADLYVTDVDYAFIQDFGTFMLEMGYATLAEGANITDPAGMAHEVAMKLATAQCTDDTISWPEYNGWVCPDFYSSQDAIDALSVYQLAALCWLDETPTNTTECTLAEYKFCNWAPALGNVFATCNNSVGAIGLNHVCVDSFGTPLTLPAGCYLTAKAVDGTLCSDLGGNNLAGFDYCYVAAADEATCNDGLDITGYAQVIADSSFCYYDLTYVPDATTCNGYSSLVTYWSPLLNLCMIVDDTVTDFTTCTSQTYGMWFQSRVYVPDDVFATEALCTGDICENGEVGLTAKECAASGGSCNVQCPVCEGTNMFFPELSSVCYIDITFGECAAIHLSKWTYGGCVVPALSAADCTKYTSSVYLTCGGVSSCTSQNALNSTLALYCGVTLGECANQHDCFSRFTCEDPLGNIMESDTEICIARCDADVDGTSLPAYGMCAWYGIDNNTCIKTMKGKYFDYPSSAAECDAYANYCLKGGATADFDTCTECGVEVPYFTSTAGVWTNYTLVPNTGLGFAVEAAALYRPVALDIIVPNYDVPVGVGPATWVKPALVTNQVYYELNFTALIDFEFEFEVFTYGVKYIPYSVNMMTFEASALQKVACFCAGNYSDLTICAENNEVIYSPFYYTGEEANLTYPAMYPGGSVMTLHLPAGLQAGLVVTVTGKPITDIYYSAGSAKRATNIEVGIFDSTNTQIGDLTADGFDVNFSVEPLSADATMCVTKPDFLQVGAAYTVADYSSYVDPTFTILNLDNTDFGVTLADATCTLITMSDYYFATMRAAPVPSSSSVVSSSTLPIIPSSSSGISTRNLALIALVCLVLLIIIPVVVIVVIVVVVRSKACKKTLRRVAPK